MTRDESTTIDPPHLKVAEAKPREVFGKYELIERLGRGGMADVWKARMAGPHGFSRMIVLKRILPHLVADKKARELFEREARVVSRLSHAHIVQVFEFGEVEGEYYLAMEHVDGRDVAGLIRAGGSGPAAAAMIIRDTARALSYGYNLRGDDNLPLRILHRDVSPSNIMVGYDGSVRLLDFGIAKALSDPRDMRTVKGTIRGKFGYIAPEIIEGRDPDARADIFSLGVVLHEMLTGKRLFRGGSDLETLSLVRRGVIPPPSQLNPSVTNALDVITLKSLSRDRDTRYANGDELADALDDVVHELRFGPPQLADVMKRHFPRDLGVPEEPGQFTVVDSPAAATGHGTAKSVDIEIAVEASDRPTIIQPAVPEDFEGATEVRGNRIEDSDSSVATVFNKPVPDVKKPASGNMPAVRTPSGNMPATKPANTVAAKSSSSSMPAAPSQPISSQAATVLKAPVPVIAKPPHAGPGPFTIVLAGIVVGGLIVAAALLGREFGRAHKAKPPITQPK